MLGIFCQGFLILDALKGLKDRDLVPMYQRFCHRIQSAGQVAHIVFRKASDLLSTQPTVRLFFTSHIAVNAMIEELCIFTVGKGKSGRLKGLIKVQNKFECLKCIM